MNKETFIHFLKRMREMDHKYGRYHDGLAQSSITREFAALLPLNGSVEWRRSRDHGNIRIRLIDSHATPHMSWAILDASSGSHRCLNAWTCSCHCKCGSCARLKGRRGVENKGHLLVLPDSFNLCLFDVTEESGRLSLTLRIATE